MRCQRRDHWLSTWAARVCAQDLGAHQESADLSRPIAGRQVVGSREGRSGYHRDRRYRRRSWRHFDWASRRPAKLYTASGGLELWKSASWCHLFRNSRA